MPIAIDVVLLPPESLTEKAIEINQFLLKSSENKIILNKEICLPHISLAMGVIDENKLGEIEQILKDIAKDLKPINLTAGKLSRETIPTGKIVSYLPITNNDDLQSLHETIMKRLKPYLSFNPEIDMLFNPEEVEEVTLYWIKNYQKKYDNPSSFHPHMTIGFGETDKFQSTTDFTAKKIALCQFGNYCTCRKVLIEVDF